MSENIDLVFERLIHNIFQLELLHDAKSLGLGDTLQNLWLVDLDKRENINIIIRLLERIKKSSTKSTYISNIL